MKKLFILCACMFLLSGAQALASTLTIDGTGFGGTSTLTSPNTWGGEIKVTPDGIPGVLDLQQFTTFCLERGEDVKPGVTYDAVVNIGAEEGGLGGQDPAGGNFDPLSPQTAWLYNQYLDLGFDFIPFDASVSDNTKGKLFQEAVWALEDELDASSLGSNEFYEAALLSPWENIGNIRVLNLTLTDENDAIIHHQDLLVRAVPIPGAVWLLGSGLLGLVGFRRRFRN